MNTEIVGLEEIFPDSYTQGIELTSMYCFEINKDITKKCINVMKDFANSQLHNNYNHLKRCRKLNEKSVQILVGFCAELPDDILNKIVQINNGKEITMKKVNVSKHPPMTRKQYVEWSVHWPLYYRKPTNELTILKNEEVNKCVHFLNVSIHIGKKFGTCQSGCVLTHNDKVIACSGDNIKNHPLQHSVMLAIEQVSFKLRHMWKIKKELYTSKNEYITEDNKYTISDMRYLSALECSPDVLDKKCKIGYDQTGGTRSAKCMSNLAGALDMAEEGVNGNKNGNKNSDKSGDKNGIKNDDKNGNKNSDKSGDMSGDNNISVVNHTRINTHNPVDNDQYLCTNYFAFLSHEPCFMCAMAMIHSRIKCVIFDKVNPANGALFSREKLHCLKKLNHHFKVYKAIRAVS
ncbi:cytidine deaminase [Plasmodium gonderi]|uniref:Cytidine deaminase n=1 Tax=Plasmodium gonderi TaxID=77519 RepID=A0A1Y1JKG1_PLAGO|nr:cytidine deaminase [Plasmodium gonderi]GAW82780.1 cytidine deaminase [Plasmodium gonderi]